ncbi:hypothetical protein [Planktotalea sp.]|uniref:hypothetical protein n=1 Tax=Planktotalea sp. TaxID=2029877 RepID=UPI003D6A78B3
MQALVKTQEIEHLQLRISASPVGVRAQLQGQLDQLVNALNLVALEETSSKDDPETGTDAFFDNMPV